MNREVDGRETLRRGRNTPGIWHWDLCSVGVSSGCVCVCVCTNWASLLTTVALSSVTHPAPALGAQGWGADRSARSVPNSPGRHDSKRVLELCRFP